MSLALVVVPSSAKLVIGHLCSSDNNNFSSSVVVAFLNSKSPGTVMEESNMASLVVVVPNFLVIVLGFSYTDT